MQRRRFLQAALAVTVTAGCHTSSEDSSAQQAAPGPFIAPADLAARLEDVKAGKIVVFYVGPDVLFARGHVPGARKLPPIESEAGRTALNDALAKVPADTEIVVYCGCCPYQNCPNVRPASEALRALGRTNARVLDLPTRFATDWSDKGFAVERG